MSLNRYLYSLKSIAKGQMKIQNRFEFEGTVKFALFQGLNHQHKNMIAITHEQDKLVKFYNLDEFLEQKDDTLSIAPLYFFKNFKKVSAITDVSFSMQGHNLRGLIIGDKVGEMHFLNIDNLDKLPKEEVESNVAKLLYGHQQSITSIQRSMCGQYLISTDTLNKVVVNQFPNVFNIQSVNTDQKTTLKDICFIDEN